MTGLGKHRSLPVAALVLMAGCASTPPAPPVTDVRPSPGAELPPPPPMVVRPGAQGGPAVIALLDDAAVREQQGDFDRSMAVLERAVRIEPRNALVWHRMARLQLRQGRPLQAESMARKSNQLSGEDRRLQAANWRLIATARRQRGDTAAADAAEDQAMVLESRLR